MHIYTITDERGDTVDAVPLCSDSCHREYAGDDYAGWDGCHESEHTTWCQSCGVVIPADDDGACDCQLRNVVVNRFVSAEGETCEHGNWIQVPVSLLER